MEEVADLNDARGGGVLVSARLIDYTNPCIVLLAIKTSQGKTFLHGVDKYWPRCSQERLRRWMVDAAAKYPSVLEHVKLTWLVECTRVCSHQLVRHRIASYTQESQRYSEDRLALAAECLVEEAVTFAEAHYDYERLSKLLLATDYWESVYEALALAGHWLPDETRERCLGIAFDTRFCSLDDLVAAIERYARERGLKSMENARYILPQCVKTTILVTMNLREFLHFYRLRRSPKAQREIRELAEAMMREAEKAIPWLREMARVFQEKMYG